MGFNPNALVNPYGGGYRASPQPNVPQMSVPQFPNGATMVAKPGNWGAALGAIGDEMSKQKDRDFKQKELDRNFEIKQKKLKLDEAKQKYDLDPTNPLNRKRLADAKKAVQESLLMSRMGQTMGIGGQEGEQQQQGGANALLAPPGDPMGMEPGRFSPGGALLGQQPMPRGEPTPTPGQPAPGSVEESELNAKRAGLLGNRPLSTTFNKEADRRNVYNKTALTERAKRDQDAEGKIELDYDAADRDLHRLNLIGQLNEVAQTGSFSGEKDAFIGMMNEIGQGELAAKIVDGSMAPTEARAAMESISNELVVGMIGQGKFPANNFSDKDREFIMAMFPKIRNMPGANRLILKILQQDRNFNKAKGEQFMNWREKNPNKDMRHWRKHWRAYKNKHNTMGDLKAEAQKFIKGAGKGKKPGAAGGQNIYDELMAK